MMAIEWNSQYGGWGARAAHWLLAGSALLLSVGPASAEPASQPLADLVLAKQLAAFAQARRDPLALTVAASIARPITARAKPGTAAPMGATALADTNAWLATAREWAGTRSDLLALIDDVQAAGGRGVMGTVESTPTKLAAKEERRFRFKFEGDADAAVALARLDDNNARGALDVDMYVTDDKGAPVCMSERVGLPKLCRWAPRRTGEFSVRVVNRLDTSADFVLLVQ